MSYASLGQDCPGQEVWHEDIGACMCPAPLITSGIVGECIPPEKETPWVSVCPPNVTIPPGTNCWCMTGHAFDEETRQCLPYQVVPETVIVGTPPSKPGPVPTKPVPTSKRAGLDMTTWLLVAAGVGGVAYLIGAN